MKIYLFLVALLITGIANSQSTPLYVDNNGYLRYIAPKKDTVIIHDTIRTVKDTVIYKDRIVYRDTTIYKDTCTTQPPPPPPPTGIDYLALPLSGAMDLSGKSNVIVENKRFSNINGVSLKLYSGANNIIIRNCFFDGATGELVELENAENITIENCLFARGLAGVYAVGSKNVKVINCQFVNMKIRYVNGNFAGRGVFVQMNSCSGGEVTNCRGENFDGESDPEDMVSCYGGSSNIIIKGNMFRGGKIGGPSTSGGGIIVGDTGGNDCIIENNTLLNPGNYGCAVAGGRFNKVINNKIYSERTSVSNNPLYVANYSGTIGCSDITVTGNRVNWTDKNGNKNMGWNSGDCANTPYNPANNQTITLAEMGVPTHLITFVTPEQLLKIRK